MSKSKQPSFDDFEPVESSDDDGGSNWIDLDAGTEVVGQITAFNPDGGHNGVVEVDGRPMYLNRSMLKDLIAALVEGRQIAVKVAEDESTFTDDDGEEVTYFEKEARFK